MAFCRLGCRRSDTNRNRTTFRPSLSASPRKSYLTLLPVVRFVHLSLTPREVASQSNRCLRLG
jgi:hypothetical protein